MTAQPDIARERAGEHQVTPLELFFDLVFVFAITQVTSFLARDPTWHGVLRGMLVLAAVWWAWEGYAWVATTIDLGEGPTRLVMIGVMATIDSPRAMRTIRAWRSAKCSGAIRQPRPPPKIAGPR